MLRREFLALTGGNLLAARAAVRRPNIVFILADDLGFGDLGCYGQKQILTPNIDGLASDGIQFTQAYAGSTVCAPSRCSLMTGMHQGHATVRGHRTPALPLRPDDVTVAEVLKKAGYRTGVFGKWHLGGPLTPGSPLAQGFDEFYGFYSGAHAQNYYPDSIWDNEAELFLNGNRGGTQLEYSHDLVMKRALEFAELHKDRPFFLYLPVQIPHANSERGRRLGDGMQVPSYEPYTEKHWPAPEKGFAAMITLLDRDIGALLGLLRRLGIEENTMVIFSSDNGPHSAGGHNPHFFDSNGPLRGQKFDLYEGGIRVPAIVRWPGKIGPGQVSDQIWASWDFLPTAAELAGVEHSRDIDGISMLSAFFGKPQENHEYLYWEWEIAGTFKQAVRMGDWKAVRIGADAPIELYNLKDDPTESNSVAGSHPETVSRIKDIMRTARSDSKE